MRDGSTTSRGSMITSGRGSVLDQLEKSLKQDRPWEKESWAEKDNPRTPARGQKVKSSISTPPFNASKIDRSLGICVCLCVRLFYSFSLALHIYALYAQLFFLRRYALLVSEQAERAAVGFSDDSFQGWLGGLGGGGGGGGGGRREGGGGGSGGGIMKTRGFGDFGGDKTSLSKPPPVAYELGKNHLPGSLEQCHDLILDLKAQLQAIQMTDTVALEKKEQTIEGISDMFALSALLPDKTRLYREYNEMKVKYQDNLEEVTRLQEELDQERKNSRDTEARLKASLAQALASGDGSAEKVLKAEEKVRDIHNQRKADAEVAIKAVESATRRADVSEQRLSDIEKHLRTHPAVVSSGLAQKEVEGILPELLAIAEERLHKAHDSEQSMKEAEHELERVVKELEDTRKLAGSQAGNVSRFNVEMDSLKAKLAKTEADLKALQVERDLVWKDKEDLASEAEQIAMSMEIQHAKHEARLADLQERFERAQDQIQRLTTAEAARASNFSAKEQVLGEEKDIMSQEVNSLQFCVTFLYLTRQVTLPLLNISIMLV